MPKVGVYVTQHRIIKDIVEQNPSGVSVDAICKDTNMEKSVVIEHLRVMEIDEYGRFIAPDESLFISREGVRMLANSFNKKSIKRDGGRNIDLSEFW